MSVILNQSRAKEDSTKRNNQSCALRTYNMRMSFSMVHEFFSRFIRGGDALGQQLLAWPSTSGY